MGVWDCFGSFNQISPTRSALSSLLLLALVIAGCSFDDTGQRRPVEEGDAGDVAVTDASNEVGVPEDASDSDSGDTGPGDTGDAQDEDAGQLALCSETCTTDDDCAGSSSLCVELPDGNVCSRVCRPSGCPDKFECIPVSSVDGASSDQCMPTSGVCADCFDEDSDGFGLGELCDDTDCDDGDDGTYPGAEELCDGVDNNCDTQVDEGCDCVNGDTQSCYSGASGTDGEGQCQAGTQTCTDGAWGACDGEVVPDADETCGDDTDNNCDGVTDEGCACDFDGATQGVCGDAQIDDTGACGAPANYEADESSCDDLDNDCDGVTDEGCSCDYDNSTDGVCAGGGTIDANGDCQAPSNYSATEMCDGVDNNCDGVTDEGCSCDYDGLTDGVCAGGGTIDANGDCQAPSDYSASELCDGVDNNCDGQADEGCSCTDGDTQACYTGTAGTAGVGECQQGSQTCSSGTWGSCGGEVVPTAEVCGNNLDENCDGVVDENCPCDYNSDADGVCANSTRDANGDCQQPADYVADESGGSCDGLDNDCDGQTDEGCCSGVDADSAVTTTSGCLTAGTGAESAIVLDLVDASGNPLSGANVTMTTDAGTLSAVNSSGNSYWAVLSPPSMSGASSATVTVSAEDSCSGQAVQMTTQVNVAFATPFTGSGGGADGCSADGNVRVRVIAADDGSPIANANVMVGDAENTSAFVETYASAPSAANTGTTDASGYVELKDFGTTMDSPLKVTAGATGHAYMTMVDIDAADLVLTLEEIAPVVDTRTYDGDFTGINSGGSLDVGFMLGDVTIDEIMDFNLDTLLAENVCYQSNNGAVGDMNLPDNVYIPSQNLGLLVGSVDEKTYGSAAIEHGERYLTGISGEVGLFTAAGGDIVEILGALDFEKIGTRAETVDANTTTSGVDIDMTNTLNDNVNCSASNAPANSNVFCLMAGDWDSRNDATLSLGAGRLFLMGLRIGDAPSDGSAFSINNVSTVGRSGLFSDVEYMGASVAAYLNDPTVAPAGTADGASIVARRDPALVGASGGSLTFDDYLPIRPLTRTGRQFAASTLSGGSYPTPHFARTTIRQEITEVYSACGTDDSERTRYNTLWTVYAPGAVDSYTLPTLPSGWPRAANGGFVDPASTAEDDVVNWMHMTLHEGLNSAFDYDAIRFESLRSNVTHASINDADF